jgi:N-acetylated-alpha-linked acidic dipeptidase
MRVFSIAIFFCGILLAASSPMENRASPASNASIFGFRDSTAEAATEARFLAVPDPKLAEEHLRTLTQAPHMAGTPEDKATADYVAQKFRAAGSTRRSSNTKCG